MKRTLLFGTMMACTIATAASVGATQDTASQSSSDKNNVVVTGCLTSGAPGASGTATGTAGTYGTAGTAGTTAGTSGAAGFILTNAILASGPASSTATGTSGTAGSTAATTGTAATTSTDPSAAGKGKSFSLIGGQPSELQQYVNSKVEIRGSLVPNPMGGSGSSVTGGGTATGTSSTTSGTGSTASGAASTTSMPGMSHASDSPQQLRVTSVRQISSSCDAGGQ